MVKDAVMSVFQQSILASFYTANKSELYYSPRTGIIDKWLVTSISTDKWFVDFRK